jgi:uncharacterized lipoprotein
MSKFPFGWPGPITLAALACAAAACVLDGCASPAPPFTAVNHQEVVPLAAPDVWRRVHAFLQDQGFRVTSEDLQAGIIDARQESPTKGLLPLYAECGGGGLLQTLQRQTADLTVRIRPVADGAQVTANAAFSQTLTARRAGAVTVACSSKGVLENAVLQVASGQPMEAAVVPR